MLQRYDISIDGEKNLLSIKEFAVLGRILRKHEYFDPAREQYLFLHKVTYDGDAIHAAIDEGKEALIIELRSDDFFPIHPCAEIIAERVIELFEDDSVFSSELFFDDHALLSKEDE